MRDKFFRKWQLCPKNVITQIVQRLYHLIFILVKAQQLSDMKAFEESMDLLIAVERVFNDKPWSIEKQKATDYLKFQKVMLKMTEYQECKGHNITETEDLEELTKDVKECFEKLTSLSMFINSIPFFGWVFILIFFSANAGDSLFLKDVFEMVVVTLLNLDQFEVILQKQHLSWNLIKLACLISSGVLSFQRKNYKTGEVFKDTCRNLAAIVLPVLQQTVSKKSF